MKKISFILFICISAILMSCGDDNSDDRLLLTNANIAGSYRIGSFNQVINESATSSSGANVNISTTTNVGDIYNLALIMNQNGTFTAKGQYTIDFTVKPNGSAQETGSSIININDSGTFSISSLNNTITFITTASLENDFVAGTYNVTLFNATTMNLVQETENSSGSLNIATKTNYSFLK